LERERERERSMCKEHEQGGGAEEEADSAEQGGLLRAQSQDPGIMT